MSTVLNVWALFVFQFWISSVSLSRELLEPYFTRLSDYRREPAILTQRYRDLYQPHIS